jgi:hypothetical protein
MTDVRMPMPALVFWMPLLICFYPATLRICMSTGIFILIFLLDEHCPVKFRSAMSTSWKCPVAGCPRSGLRLKEYNRRLRHLGNCIFLNDMF